MINGKLLQDNSFESLICDRCEAEDNLIIQDNGEELCKRCNEKLIEEKLIEEENLNNPRTMKEFEEFKKELLQRAKEADACIDEFRKAGNASDKKELLAVIKDNISWCFYNKALSTDQLLECYSKAELKEENIFISGRHLAENCIAVALGNSTVEAWGNSTVKAWGNSTVKAWDNSTVRALGNSTVEAWDNSTVKALDNSTVKAWGNSTVEAWDNSTVKALGNSTVEALGNSTVEALDNSFVRNYTGKEILIEENAIVRCASTKKIYIKKSEYEIQFV